MDSEITILQLRDTIIVPIQVELHDVAARKLQDEILLKIEKTGAKGLIIDISAIFIIDSFLGRLLSETAKMAQIMGTTVVLTGMKKETAITLIQLGLTFKNLKSTPNLEEALVYIEVYNEKQKNSKGNE
jgi:rsbT antagonist protein RsbS